MIIDLSILLSQERAVINKEVPLQMDSFATRLNTYTVVASEPMSFTFTGLGKKKVRLDAHINVTLSLPCDRCLEDTSTVIDIATSGEINLGDTDITRADDLDEMDYLDGVEFDAEKYAYGEILVNLPMKVLCKEDCKGICNRCGTNLNHGECGCVTTELDPRMAKAMEVFKSFKEV